MKLAAIVPTLGRCPHLERSLLALRAQASRDLEVEIVLIDQGESPSVIPAGLADQILRPSTNLGFAAGTNLGIAATSSDLVATVNDDAIVEEGWAAALLSTLSSDPKIAAVQGVNVQLDAPERVDGWGLAWNSWWQAIQLGHGEPPPARDAPACEVFGVSATAAIYRRAALDTVKLAEASWFDPALGSYYEDAELAGRLRAEGFSALSVPAARALHAGSATAGSHRWPLVYGNRHLAAARLLGRKYWLALPKMLVRDGADFAQAIYRGETTKALGILRGLGRAVAKLRAFVHFGSGS